MSSEKKSLAKRAGRIVLLLLVAIILARIMYYFEVANKKTSNNPWSSEYTASFYKTIYNKIAVSSSDSSGIRLMTNCVVDKFKAKYPLGINNLGNDSLRIVYEHAAKDCMKNIIVRFGWSEQADSSIRHGIMNSDWINKIPIKAQKPLCDCYIVQLKKIYPAGVTTQIPKSVKDSLIFYCAKNISKY
jgi:hypothetical protein